MSETLNFSNYRMDQYGLDDIYSIGRGGDHETGVVEEMAAAFDFELSETPSDKNIGDLIGVVGPAKELQENIGNVQEALGTSQDAVEIARGWVERSGLLLPVERSFVGVELDYQQIDLAIITGGVRNWMMRRAERHIQLRAEHPIGQTLLVSGNRKMKSAEGPDVTEGMTESKYMLNIFQKIISANSLIRVAQVDSSVGDEVMDEAARAANDQVDLKNKVVAIVSNAGAWVQNAGQFRRAVRRSFNSNYDQDGKNLLVVSDSFPLGTGVEPTSTHQNPFSAAGQILRNIQELIRNL